MWGKLQLKERVYSLHQFPQMSDKNFPDVIREIHDQDNRFGKGAYYFIREALDHTLKSMEKTSRGKVGMYQATNYWKALENMPLKDLAL